MMEAVKNCDICQEKQHAHQCKDCGKDESDILLLCEDCHHAIHRGRFSSHKVEKAAGQEIRDFCSSLDTFKSKSSELKRRLEEVCNSKRDLLKYSQIHQSHIKEVATKLQQKIKSQAEDLLGQVQQVSEEKTGLLAECEELCRNVMMQHQTLCKEADEILGNPDDSLQDKTEKVAQFQEKLEIPLLADLETKFPDIRIHLMCDVSSVLTAISDWQLTAIPAPPDDLAEINVGSCQQIETGTQQSVFVESRMSAKGIIYIRQELDVPTREVLSALSLHIRRAGVLGALGDWMGGEGSVCAVRHPGDMMWYRGLVEELKKDKALVRLLDYGTVETVPLADLAELPPTLPQLPFQAVACTFFEDETEEIPREARWLFSDLSSHKEITCTFEREIKTDMPITLWKVDLQDVEGGVNIAERIITAVKEEGTKAEKVSCRDIRLKHNAEDFVPGSLTVIRTNAADKGPSPEPDRGDSQVKAPVDGSNHVMIECTGEEAVSASTSLPPQVEMKTPSETEDGNILLNLTSVQDTSEAVTVSDFDKDVRTCDEAHDGKVLSATRPGLPLKEGVTQGADTAESLVSNKPVSGVFPGTIPRILARGETYVPLQPTLESVRSMSSESAPDTAFSSEEKGADARPTFSAAHNQFHQSTREDNRLSSFSHMATTERSQCGQYTGLPLWWEKLRHTQQGAEHVQPFPRIPCPQPPSTMYPPPEPQPPRTMYPPLGPQPPRTMYPPQGPQPPRTMYPPPDPQPPRTMYPPPGIPIAPAPPEGYSIMNRPGPHHFVPIAGDLPPTWQGNSYPYLEGIVATCDGQVEPYPERGDNMGAVIPPTTMNGSKTVSGLQDFDALLMSELTACHGFQQTSDACSSVSNGDSHSDGFSTKDRAMACASAPYEEVIRSSTNNAMDSTAPVDQESCMVSSDKLYPDGTVDREQADYLPASAPSTESRSEEADQTKEGTYTTESTIIPPSDAVTTTTSLSAVDASDIMERPRSNPASGGISSGEDSADNELEEFCIPCNSVLGVANQPVIALADNKQTESLSTFANPTFVTLERSNTSTKPDSTSAAMSPLYEIVATEACPIETVNSAFPTVTASSAEEAHPYPQPCPTNGSLQNGHQNPPEQAALVSLTGDVVIEGEVLSDELSQTSDEYASPLLDNLMNLAEGDPDNSSVSTNGSAGCAEDDSGKGLPGEESEKCSSSGKCAALMTDMPVDHTYANVHHITDTSGKPGENVLEEGAKLQDGCMATCSVGSSGEEEKSRLGTEGRESNPSLCEMFAADSVNDAANTLDQNTDTPGRLSEISSELHTAGDHPGTGTSSHPSHHQENPPDRPSSMETGSLEQVGSLKGMEDLQEGFVTGPNMKACVTHPMEPDGSFWTKNIPVEDNEYKLMMDEMRAEAPLLEAVMGADSCILGLLVCAVSAKENMWYRGEIEKKFNKTALVRFVDLGKAEEIAYVDIKPLPNKYQRIDFQVQKNFLAGVNTDLSEKQVELFNKLTANGRTLWSQVTCVLPSGERTVRLWELDGVELTINQQVAQTQKDRLDSCVYNQHGRGSTTRLLHVPGFQHGQFHSSPPRDTPAHLGAANMEPMRSKSAPPGPQGYLESAFPGQQRRASGDQAWCPRHLMGLLGPHPLTFQVHEVPFWNQREQGTREHLVPQAHKEQRPHPYPRQEKPSRSDQQHMERRPAQKQYIPPHLRHGWQQRQQQNPTKSQQHKQLQPPEKERQQTCPLGTPCPRDLSTVGEGSQMIAENKAMTSGSSEDWDDAIDDWTDGKTDKTQQEHPVVQEPDDKHLAEGTSDGSGITTATDETGADSRSVSGCSSPARSVQSVPSVFDEDDWVEGEDPLSQRADLGSQQEPTQPGPPNTQGYLMQSADTRRQPAVEPRPPGRNGTGAHPRRSGPNNNREGCFRCGKKGHIRSDCPGVNGRSVQKNGRKNGRKSNQW
ncbi:uncharacterized protein LOC144876772 isoform X4 [Branchiostoma floridae x Branchiostoma japonicum]